MQQISRCLKGELENHPGRKRRNCCVGCIKLERTARPFTTNVNTGRVRKCSSKSDATTLRVRPRRSTRRMTEELLPRRQAQDMRCKIASDPSLMLAFSSQARSERLSLSRVRVCLLWSVSMRMRPCQQSLGDSPSLFSGHCPFSSRVLR